MTENKICAKHNYAQHITVECKGCAAKFSTKNIGRTKPNGAVHTERSLFRTGDDCSCEDSSKFPLIHKCEIIPISEVK